MIFNSLQFLVFFPVVTGLYFCLPHHWRWLMLLIASAIFYMAFIPKYILILLATILVDYVAAILIDRTNEKNKKYFLILSIVANIGFLAFFKYFNFFALNLNELAEILHWNYSVSLLNIILPIGLSFHTFQSISYVVEVYRGHQAVEKHLGIFALYVLFYPQLVAGPIERPQNLLHQFREKHFFVWSRVESGLRRMLWGLFKKIVIADNIAVICNQVFDHPTEYQGLHLVIASVLFAFQIYCDFSGYSDIAIGAARVMGFKLMENFQAPYFSKSISEFWRRWHISLSTWLKDYVYIPLGGSRVHKYRHWFNLIFVFMLSGLWHGANWTYIIWGTLHGMYLVLALVLKTAREWSTRSGFDYKIFKVPPFLQSLIVFILVDVAWIFFRAETLGDAYYILTHLTSGLHKAFSFSASEGNSFLNVSHYLGVSQFVFMQIVLSVIGLLGFEWLSRHTAWLEKIKNSPGWLRFSLYNTLIVGIIYFGYFGDQPFIYFQF